MFDIISFICSTLFSRYKNDGIRNDVFVSFDPFELIKSTVISDEVVFNALFNAVNILTAFDIIFSNFI